jgi:topoisomerase-4 subunit A
MTFQEVKARRVALSNLTVGYNIDTGLMGYHVKSDCDIGFACSEYDRILLIMRDGCYKIINVVDKVFVGHDVIWADKVERKTIFNLIYRDGSKGYSFVKRFKTPKFILGKEYRLFPEHKGSFIQFLQTGENIRVRVTFAPLKRAKTNSQRLYMDQVLIKGATALGKRVSTRVVRQISELVGKVSEFKPEQQEPIAEVVEPQSTAPTPANGSPETAKQKSKDMTQLALFDPEKKDDAKDS